jgi:hypothetical protein
MTLRELQRIKQWHVDHRRDRPVEYHLWDAVLTLWLMGWVGWLPTFLLDDIWAAPLCFVGACLPSLYIHWRLRAHHTARVRCDWAGLLARPEQQR